MGPKINRDSVWLRYRTPSVNRPWKTFGVLETNINFILFYRYRSEVSVVDFTRNGRRTVLGFTVFSCFHSAVSTRLVAGIWWFFTLIMVSSYTANLAAFLTVESVSEPFKNVEELVNQNVIAYGLKKRGSTEEYFRVRFFYGC